MESLYVCLFSNGHIKVGRSIDADSRMAQHADRVACLGVELSNRFSVDCAGPASKAEALLIARCNEKAERRHKNEWFVGLDFLDVTGWAQECASMRDVPRGEAALPGIDFERPDFPLILLHLKVAGLTQMEIASFCGCGQSSISDLASGKTKDPSYSVGASLIRLAKSHIGLAA